MSKTCCHDLLKYAFAPLGFDKVSNYIYCQKKKENSISSVFTFGVVETKHPFSSHLFYCLKEVVVIALVLYTLYPRM